MWYAVICALSLVADSYYQATIWPLDSDDFQVRKDGYGQLEKDMSVPLAKGLLAIRARQETLQVRDDIETLVTAYKEKLLSGYAVNMRARKTYPQIHVGMPDGIEVDNIFSFTLDSRGVVVHYLVQVGQCLDAGNVCEKKSRMACEMFFKEKLKRDFEYEFDHAGTCQQLDERMRKRLVFLQRIMDKLQEAQPDE